MKYWQSQLGGWLMLVLAWAYILHNKPWAATVCAVIAVFCFLAGPPMYRGGGSLRPGW